MVGHADLVVGLLRELHQDGTNLVLSPYSIVSALIMLMIGTEPNSRHELLKLLSSSPSSSSLQQSSMANESDKFLALFAKQNDDILRANAKTFKSANMVYPAKR